MVRAFDPDELLRVCRGCDDGLNRCDRAISIMVAADEELWLPALWQIGIGIFATLRLNRQPQRNQAGYPWIAAAGPHANSLVMRALAEAGAAKVEAQHRKAEPVQGLHGVVDNLVVHGSAAQGVGMADQRRIA